MSDFKESVSALGVLAAGAGASWGAVAATASGATTAAGTSLAGGAAVTTALCTLGGGLAGGIVMVGAIDAGTAYFAYRGIKAIWGIFA